MAEPAQSISSPTKRSDLTCSEHNEPLKGLCMYPNICAQRLMCRLCRQTHEEKHFRFYEDLDDVLEGKMIKELGNITLKVDNLTTKIKNSDTTLSTKLDELSQELQTYIAAQIKAQKENLQKSFRQNVYLNQAIVNEVSVTKKELESKLKKSQLANTTKDGPRVLEDLACYCARIHNRFLNNESSFNKYITTSIEDHNKVNEQGIIDKFRTGYQSSLKAAIKDVVDSFPSLKYPLDANLLPEFHASRLNQTAIIPTGHKGIWWGALVYIPNKEHIISGGNEGLIKVWEKQSKKLIQQLHGDHGWISKLLYIPEKELLLSGGQDCKIRVWDVNQMYQLKYIFSEHTKEIYCMEYLSDLDIVASGGNDGTIKLWDINNGEIVQTVWAEGEVFRCLCYLKHMSWLAAGLKSGAILVFRMERENPALMYSIKFSEMSSMLCMRYIESEDVIVTGEIDGKISIWKLGQDEGTCIAAYKTNGAVYNIEAFYHQDYIFYTNDDTKWRIMRLSTGEVVKEFIGNSKDKRGTCLTWMKKNYNVVTGFTDEIRVWEYSL